jgi:ABC-type multidrug transport system permease subunit
MFRGLWAIIYKEVLQLRRDPATAFVFLIPAIQLTIFGFAIDQDIQHIPTVVFDMDRSMESRKLVEQFGATGTFDLLGEVFDSQEINRRIVAGTAKVGIIIPPDYSACLLQGQQATVQVLIDGSDSVVATNATLSSGLLGQVQSMARLGASLSEIAVDVRPRVLFTPDLVSARFYVPGLIGIILQVVTMMLTAFAIVRERERGTLEQLVVTPVTRGALVLGKLVPYAVIGMGQTLFVLMLMRYLFQVEIEGDVFLLLALSALFLLPALAMGILISTLAVNQAQAMQVTLLIMLPSVLLSGFAFPRETMPAPIYGLTFLIPVTYYVQILRGIILRGAGLWALWPQTLALIGFALILLTISGLRFQKRLG